MCNRTLALEIKENLYYVCWEIIWRREILRHFRLINNEFNNSIVVKILLLFSENVLYGTYKFRILQIISVSLCVYKHSAYTFDY